MHNDSRLSTIGLRAQSWQAFTADRERADVMRQFAAEAWSREARRDRFRASLLHDKARLLRLLSGETTPT